MSLVETRDFVTMFVGNVWSFDSEPLQVPNEVSVYR